MISNRLKNKIVINLMGLFLLGVLADAALAQSNTIPFAPGEKLKYALRWENIPAGELYLEIHPITTINRSKSYHFVMIAKSNSTVDMLYKVRDRIDAYANTDMTRSEFYKKKQSGKKTTRDQRTIFNWPNNTVQYAEAGHSQKPVQLLPGTFDPLSAFYYTRMTISEQRTSIEMPVTDGKKNTLGKARIIGRETITLKNGKRYDTFVLEPDVSIFGGVFKASDDPRLRVWITADEKRIPVQIKAKVKVGHFIGELVSAKGV